MCRATDMLRHLVGIHEYAPISTTRALLRTPTWYGARGHGRNGFHSPDGLTIPGSPAISALEREQRYLRACMNDLARRRYG